MSDFEFLKHIHTQTNTHSYVPYEEAIEHAYNVGNPVLAAKKLLSIAESYGSKENIAVLVLRINTEPGEEEEEDGVYYFNGDYSGNDEYGEAEEDRDDFEIYE